jgi:hypothetical protein
MRNTLFAFDREASPGVSVLFGFPGVSALMLLTLKLYKKIMLFNKQPSEGEISSFSFTVAVLVGFNLPHDMLSKLPSDLRRLARKSSSICARPCTSDYLSALYKIQLSERQICMT